MTDHRVLVVDDDLDIAQFTELALTLEGFTVALAPDGPRAIDTARDFRPDVVLLDLMMPGMDGLEVIKRLRAEPRTTNVAILVVTARTLREDAVEALGAGADDYITKPFDPEELVARVRASLNRTRRLVDASPLTGLPGNHEILRRLEALVVAPSPRFALAHADIDRFKAYNDCYGFLRGDAAIVRTAEVLRDALLDASPGAFLGHIGGDDFAAILDPDEVEPFCRRAIEAFDQSARALYAPADAQRGAILVRDRRGGTQVVPLMTLSIGVATTAARPLRSVGEASAIAGELKTAAKALGRSGWIVDRRRK